MFRVLFPEIYQEFQAAFDAGVWEREDPGPWLGRAIVYKLQVELHVDQQDLNPTASFPCGSFTGGEMVVPQLPTKFRCVNLPGYICRFIKQCRLVTIQATSAYSDRQTYGTRFPAGNPALILQWMTQRQDGLAVCHFFPRRVLRS